VVKSLKSIQRMDSCQAQSLLIGGLRRLHIAMDDGSDSDVVRWLAEQGVMVAVCQSECGRTYALNAFTTAGANHRDFPRLSALIGLWKISRSDPPLTAACAAYATPPLRALFHPPVERAGRSPRC
jgi:hypothetical protein